MPRDLRYELMIGYLLMVNKEAFVPGIVIAEVALQQRSSAGENDSVIPTTVHAFMHAHVGEFVVLIRARATPGREVMEIVSDIVFIRKGNIVLNEKQFFNDIGINITVYR